MERLGKINKVEIYYLHWDDPKRDFYLEWLPDKIYALFLIADDENRKEDYKMMADFFARKNVIEVTSSGKECGLIDYIFDNAIISKEVLEGRDHGHPDFLEGTATTNEWDNFDWGYWMTLRISEYNTVDEIICIDFTEQRVRKYLKQITKVVRKEWSPRIYPKGKIIEKEPLYDDEIKKPLKRSQRGFERN
jgi:hypothetical protein